MLDEISNIKQEIDKESSQKSPIEEVCFLYRVMFKKEEALYKHYGYPDQETHKAIHDEFIRTILSAETQLQDGLIDKSLVVEYIETWSKYHTEHCDSIAMAFVRTRELLQG